MCPRILTTELVFAVTSHGTWRPYSNVFNVCDELGIKPFTDWTRSDSFSPLGKETSAPIFADLVGVQGFSSYGCQDPAYETHCVFSLPKSCRTNVFVFDLILYLYCPCPRIYSEPAETPVASRNPGLYTVSPRWSPRSSFRPPSAADAC